MAGREGAATPGAVTQPEPPSGIRLIGPFTVERGSGLLTGAALGSRKARTVLKLLAVRRGDHVSPDTMVDVLWGDNPPAKAIQNVASLVSRLRSLLGAEVVEGGRDGYRLSVPPGCVVDVDEAARLVDEAYRRLDAGAPALAASAADRALDILGSGTVLTDEPDAAWVDEARQDVGALLRRAREAGWQARFAMSDPHAALAHAEQCLLDDPYHEAAHRATMLAHYRLGEQAQALAAYERLREMLGEEFGTDPSPESEELYLTVLRGEPTGSDAAAAGQRPATHPGGGIVGRDRELASALDTWTAATQGTASCLLITGHAGIGKTRLAAELADHARATGALVIHARCYPAERSLFLQPLVEAVRAVASVVPADAVLEAAGDHAGPLGLLVPELAEIFGETDYQPAGPELERRREFEAIASLLAELSVRRPVLLLLDDLHEAGSSTVEACHFVLRWQHSARVLIVATARTDVAVDVVAPLAPVCTTIELGPLDTPAVHALARDAGMGHQAGLVLEKTRGHALFVVEALRAMSEGREGRDGPVPVPASLRSAVLSRVDRCGRPVVEFLQSAVIAGGVLDLNLVAELLDVPIEEAVRRAERALRAGLLAEAGNAYEFANDLVADIIYASVPAPTRVTRHRRLAGMLADRPEVAAAHAAAAADWGIAAERWVEAASRALAAFSNHEAELLLSRALDAHANLGEPVETAGVRLLRGRARLAQGRFDEATADLIVAERHARDTGDAQTEAAAVTEQGWVAYHSRDMSRAYSLAEQAVAHPGANDDAAVLAGRMRNTAGDLPGAVAALQPVADDATDADPAVRAKALSYLGTALTHGDRYAAAVDVLDRAGEQCRRAGLLRPMINAWVFLAMSHANLGNFETALHWTARLARDAERFDAVSYLPRALNFEAWICREIGEPERGYDLAQRALEACALPDGRFEDEPAANALFQLAESAMLRGDWTEAERRLDMISAHLPGAAYTWRIELRILELVTRLDPARADELLARAQASGAPKYEALALAHLGRREEALAIARAADSPILAARVGPEKEAQAAVDILASRLTTARRETFLRRGSLVAKTRPG